MVNDIGANEIRRIFFKNTREKILGIMKRSLA
jgi:hypothetical protein